MSGFGAAPHLARRKRAMREFDHWLTMVAAVGAGVNGGVFFAFSFVVMPGLRNLPHAQGIAAMQSFNDTAVMPPLMLVLNGTALVCVLLAVRAAMMWGAPAAPWLLGGALAYLLAAWVVTGVANVPISAAIDALNPSTADAGARWADLYTEWVWGNHLRTLSSIGGAAAFMLALHPPGRHSRTDT